MSPVNEGEIEYHARLLMQDAQEGMAEMMAQSILDEAKAARRKRTETDVAFREYHEYAFGEYIGIHVPTWGQHSMARTAFDIPNLTETPVDRWIARWRTH